MRKKFKFIPVMALALGVGTTALADEGSAPLLQCVLEGEVIFEADALDISLFEGEIRGYQLVRISNDPAQGEKTWEFAPGPVICVGKTN